jgi:hypothetical protein
LAIILTGESHGTADVQAIDQAFLVNQQIFPHDERLAMSDFIQYILFVRNSKAIFPM